MVSQEASSEELEGVCVWRGGCKGAAAAAADGRDLHSQTRWKRLLPSWDMCCCQSRGASEDLLARLGVHVAQEGTDIHPTGIRLHHCDGDSLDTG